MKKLISIVSVAFLSGASAFAGILRDVNLCSTASDSDGEPDPTIPIIMTEGEGGNFPKPRPGDSVPKPPQPPLVTSRDFCVGDMEVTVGVRAWYDGLFNFYISPNIPLFSPMCVELLNLSNGTHYTVYIGGTVLSGDGNLPVSAGLWLVRFHVPGAGITDVYFTIAYNYATNSYYMQ